MVATLFDLLLRAPAMHANADPRAPHGSAPSPDVPVASATVAVADHHRHTLAPVGDAAGDAEALMASVAPPAVAPTPEAPRAWLVEKICTAVPGVGRAFLDRFRDDELRAYLDHLAAATTPRGRAARWSRPDRARAIVGAESPM